MLTIQEWVKTNETPLQSGIVEIFARENAILANLPFMNTAGNAFRYNREDTLPGVAFRGFNEGYAESVGVINPVTENLTILGGDSDYDVAQIAMGTGTNDTRAVYDAMKAKALTLTWLRTFFDGDSSVNTKEFDGLNVRLTGDQVLSAGANGASVELGALDELVDAVVGEPSVLVMNKKVRRQVLHLARQSSVLSVSSDQFGREVTSYAGVPMVVVEDDETGSPILGFDETQGTSNETASIYALRFGPDMVHGIQTAPMSVRDLGEIDAKPALRTRIEWYSGVVLKHPRCAARLKGIVA